MRIGLYLPTLSATTRDAIIDVARTAERLGFDSLWLNSHTAIPVTFADRYPYSEDGRPSWTATSPWPDALTTLAFVSAVTERVRIGVAVVPLITTDPLTLAKQAATIDFLSNGRFELGIGAGWMVEEAAALGRPTDHRTARLDETIRILRLAWTSETFSFDGPLHPIGPVGIHPHPPQGGRLPLWIGGQGDAAIRLAAAHDAGLFIWMTTPKQLAEYRAKLRAQSASAPLAAPLFLAGIHGGWADAVDAMRDAGADLLIVGRRYDEGFHADLERFAREVLAG